MDILQHIWAQYLWTSISDELLIAALLGAVVGLERELSGKDPGLRTFTLVSLGSCVFSLVSIDAAIGIPNAEPSRIAAQIIPGIGFLGAGAIFRSRHGVAGLTTAALLWVTAGMGMAVGFGLKDVAISSLVMTIVVMYLFKIIHRLLDHLQPSRRNKPHVLDEDGS
jgi:putative Mg2+ transporter-C (MgtC) family protein